MDPDLSELFEEGSGEDEIAAIIRLGHFATLPEGVRVITQFGEIITARLKRGSIPRVSQAEEVASMTAGGPLLGPDLEEVAGIPEVSLDYLPGIDDRRASTETATGRGVVIGVVDWGFDFAHPDFRAADGSTRILALWDQRGGSRTGSPQPFGYGIVHNREAINRALSAKDPYAALGYHPADSDTGRGCHGTHVASIAAGSGGSDRPVGVAPNAELVFVHNAPLSQEASPRLGDSVTLLEAIDFIARTAADRPFPINLSMGRHGESHKGISHVEQGLDAMVRSAPGRAVINSCGNYFDKRIHSYGQVRSTEKRTFAWEINEEDPTDNELEIWYSWRDKLEVEIRAPDDSVSARVNLGERAKLMLQGKEVGNAYHRQDPDTLDIHIDIFLYRRAPSGVWAITVTALDVVDGRFHAWIERDATCPHCQSRFRAEDAVKTSTTGTICNGFRTIAVGAYSKHDPELRVAPFSSVGPTADGRLKPDLCAPGVSILAARSTPRTSHGDVPLLTRMSGTSMAAPHVTGTVALMFQVAPRKLRIEETRNLLLESAQRVVVPEEIQDRIGIGYLDTGKAVDAAREIGSPGLALKEQSILEERLTGNQPKLSTLEVSDRDLDESVHWADADSTTNVIAPEREAIAIESMAEDIVSAAQGCSLVAVDCLYPPESDLKMIRAKGTREGDYLERTSGDPSVNLALQLIDYDINAYLPNKARHAEALGKIRDFVVNRSVQTKESIAITITGSASRTGGKAYNDVLSCKRAKCAAENLRQSLGVFRGLLERVQINSSGEGFTRATCKGSECELDEWRSVLVQVHAPNNPPDPIPPVDPGWDKYTIQCCSYHTENVASALLGDLLKKGLPQVPDSLRGQISKLVKKGLSKLLDWLRKSSPQLGRAVAAFGELLELFPADVIRETGVFEIRERDRSNPRRLVLCYSGWGLRIILPRTQVDEFIDDAFEKLPFFKNMPDLIQKQIKEAIKKFIPEVVKTLVQPIESDAPGPVARFDLRHPRHLRVFKGAAQVGKGIWMPGQVNVEFDSEPWRRPDPLQRPKITGCPDTTCNESGVQVVVGKGQGLEFFSITQGDLVPGSCVCTVSPRIVEGTLGESEIIETTPAKVPRSVDQALADSIGSNELVPILDPVRSRAELQKAPSEPNSERLLSAAEIFDAFALPGHKALREQLAEHFEIIALPGANVNVGLRAGDLLIRRGAAESAHVSMIASAGLPYSVKIPELRVGPEQSVTVNSVTDAEPNPHQSDKNFLDGLTDSAGRLLDDLLLLRLAMPAPTVVKIEQPSKADQPSSDVEEMVEPAETSQFDSEIQSGHSQALTEAGGPARSLGVEWVEMAEQAVTGGALSQGPNALLHHLVTEAEIAETFASSAREHLPSAQEVFDAFTYLGHEQLRDQLEQCFELVASPRSRLEVSLQPGDLIVRRGEAEFGHIAIVAAPERFSHDELIAAGLVPELNIRGSYVQVVEGGPYPHARSDLFARRVTEIDDFLPHNQLLLRPKIPLSVETALKQSGTEFAPRTIAADEDPPRVLARGASGEAVQNLQATLNLYSFNEVSAGRAPLDAYPLEEDGKFGPLTERAVRDFQMRQFPGDASQWDGIVGPRTREKLNALNGGTPRRNWPSVTPLPSPTVPPAFSPLSSDLDMLRNSAGALITAFVPSDTGDARFDEIAQDYGGKGTTCGFLCHWLLWRLGCTNREIVNRNAPNGYTYRVGQNISRIWNRGLPPFVGVVSTGRIAAGERPEKGDIVLIKTPGGPDTTEHVFVFLQELQRDGAIFWRSADAGQRNAANQQCARYVERELIIQGRDAILRKSNETGRTVYGWLSLANLAFGAPPMALPESASMTDYLSSGEGNVTHTADLSDSFFAIMHVVAASLQTQPQFLLAVMNSESGIRPFAHNPNGGASGLIQFMPATLRRLGWTMGPEAFRRLTAEEQMPFVERYYRPYVRQGLNSTARLYQVTFLPATLSRGSEPDTILVDVNNHDNAFAYAPNRGLDRRGDGRILVGDLTALVERSKNTVRWREALERLQAAAPGPIAPTPVTPVPTPPVPVVPKPPIVPPVPIVPPIAHPMLRVGSRGEAVREAQTKLNTVHNRNLAESGAGLRDAPLAVDGIFGPRTQNAVVSFQHQAFPADSREWDGIIGPKTWGALDTASARVAGEISPGTDPQLSREEVMRWFASGTDSQGQPMGRAKPGNRVSHLIRGRDTFDAMMRAMRTGSGPGHFIYLLGWWMSDDFPISGGMTMRQIFTAASQAGITVRAMLWDQPGKQNSSEVDHINALPSGAAILDNRTLDGFGCHHQKILIVNGTEGLYAFCGGVDINRDRILAVTSGTFSSGGVGTPMHDVHCQIQGSAAFDLLQIFQQRWNDHPNHVDLDRLKGAPPTASSPAPMPNGREWVQIGRTFGNGNAHRGIDSENFGLVPRGYTFLRGRAGEQTAKSMILHAISQARRFIYLEDQYLVSLEVRDALVRALPNLEHLTILLPDASISDLPQHRLRQYEFISPLRSAGGSKVRVFHPFPPNGPFGYVHAKTWVFDDVYAIIGSANCNNRGYTHDSEVVAGICGESGDGGLRFAHRLRVELWALHLKMTPADLIDGVASAAFWLRPTGSGRVEPHDETVGAGTSKTAKSVLDVAWLTEIDPDGS